MKDFRGEELQTGDLIAYARRRGSSLWLEQATVQAGRTLYDGKLRATNHRTGNTVTLAVLDYVIKLSPPTVPFLGTEPGAVTVAENRL